MQNHCLPGIPVADFGGFQYDRIFICFFQKRVAEKAFSALLIYRGKTNFYGIASKANEYPFAVFALCRRPRTVQNIFGIVPNPLSDARKLVFAGGTYADNGLSIVCKP